MSRRMMMWPGSRRLTVEDVKCDVCLSLVTAGIPRNGCAIYLRRDTVLDVPINYEITYTAAFDDFYASADASSPAPLYKGKKTAITLAANVDYSAILENTAFLPTMDQVASYFYNQMPNWGATPYSGLVQEQNGGTSDVMAGTQVKAYQDNNLLWETVLSRDTETFIGYGNTFKFIML